MLCYVTLCDNSSHLQYFSILSVVPIATAYVTPVLAVVILQGQSACQYTDLTFVAWIWSVHQGRVNYVRGVRVSRPGDISGLLVFPHPVDLQKVLMRDVRRLRV